MSAIFGILRFDVGAVAAGDLERMANTLAHRGPDRCKFVVEGPAGLGHGLMRVNREDLYEAQPLHDAEARLTLAADCRIDNRAELAAVFGIGAQDLPKVPDSALIMRAYKTWGEDCASHLLGDFAFAIWDGAARKLVLARDHMGQRYVHYHHGRDFFVFATEIKALWAVDGVPRRLPDVQVGRLLMQARPPSEGETAFDGIAGLPGATVMTIDASGAAGRRRYWQPHADPAHCQRDEAYYVAAYRRVLGEAVACRIRRVVRPPGLVFSGGYDSAAIAGLAGPILAGTGHKLIAASSVMPADYRGSIRHARPWVAMCVRDMDHLDVRYVTRDGQSILSGLDRAFAAGGVPASSYHFVTHKLLAALAGGGAQLIMDGHGGDYTLHPRGQAALARFLATFQFRRFAAELRGHLRMSGHSLWRTLKSDVVAMLLPPAVLTLWRAARRGFTPVWSDCPIEPAFARRIVAAGVIGSLKSRGPARPRLDMRQTMTVALQDAMAAAVPGLAMEAALLGLEMTRPFHDKRVVELALAIPQNLYVKNGRNRYLACAALKDIYPAEFQTRWRRNDDEIPDFQRMAKTVEPQLLAEIARMERTQDLTQVVDFAKIRALLAARGIDDHSSGWERETQLALHSFTVARYAKWFRGRNR